MECQARFPFFFGRLVSYGSWQPRTLNVSGAFFCRLFLLESDFPGIRAGVSPLQRKHLLCLAYPIRNP